MTAPSWVSDYIGRPFDVQDLDPGCHCWGLVRRVLAARAGIEVPSYAETSGAQLLKAARHMNDDSRTPPWRDVWTAPRRTLDVVLMTQTVGHFRTVVRAPVHCGVMVSPTHVLHVQENTDSCVVPLTHWSVAGRIGGFYRHEGLK